MSALQQNDAYIGTLLVRDGLLTPEDLKVGLEEQKKSRDFLCATLVRMGFASEEKIFSILSMQIGVPYVRLKDIRVEPSMLHRVPVSFARAFKCLPLRVVDDVFYLAMADPLNSKAVDEIKAYLSVEKVKIFLTGDQELTEAISRTYGSDAL